MKERIRTTIKTKHFFIYLLPVFFVLNGFIENYDLVRPKDALIILVIYLIAACLIAAISFLFLKDRYKAHLFTFSLLFINFFFGVVTDSLNRIAKDSIFTKYSFLLTAPFIILAIIFIWLKRKKEIPRGPGLTLNIFFILLILVDMGWLVFKINSKNDPVLFRDTVTLNPSPSPGKPDIYLIIADEYAGNTELKDLLGFDNSAFEKELSQRRFYTLQNSISNYNYTVISMASTLNMTYLELNHNDLKSNFKDGLRAMRETSVLGYFKRAGYRIYNFSIFRTNDPQNDGEEYFKSSQLLVSSTLLYHIADVIHYKFVEKLGWKFFDRGLSYKPQRINNYNYTNTLELTKIRSDSPRFVYTHLVIPHFPYYFDKNGKPNLFEKLRESNKFSKKDYLEYLQYANKKLITLIDEIRKNSARPPVIILMSDHGFRLFNEPVDKKYHFSNHISIYLPQENYRGFYDGMSNVNMFRVFLNTEFGQNLPILKDSTIFLRD